MALLQTGRDFLFDGKKQDIFLSTKSGNTKTITTALFLSNEILLTTALNHNFDEGYKNQLSFLFFNYFIKKFEKLRKGTIFKIQS